MNRWIIFFKERLPLPILVLMSVGAGLSGGSTITPAVMPALFLVTLRIMDEVKDFTKDLSLHPDRPLPRGLISVIEAKRVITGGLVMMASFAFYLGLASNLKAASLYLASTMYLWLMYKEFYIGQSLERSPILYALTHQVVMLPLSGAIQAYTNPDGSVLSLCLTPGLLYLGAFFTFEICRKLDPEASPLLGTYRVTYGSPLTFVMVFLTSLVTAFGAALLGTLGLAFMIIAMVPPVSYIIWVRQRYKVVESVSAIVLLIMIWAPFILRMIS